jgi:hypothetical protein
LVKVKAWEYTANKEASAATKRVMHELSTHGQREVVRLFLHSLLASSWNGPVALSRGPSLTTTHECEQTWVGYSKE